MTSFSDDYGMGIVMPPPTAKVRLHADALAPCTRRLGGMREGVAFWSSLRREARRGLERLLVGSVAETIL